MFIHWWVKIMGVWCLLCCALLLIALGEGVIHPITFFLVALTSVIEFWSALMQRDTDENLRRTRELQRMRCANE